jgi:arylsulfatase A
MKLAKYFSIFSSIFGDERPNVILLLTDDFGVGDFQVNQARAKVPTPNIDRLGTEGVNFKVFQRIKTFVKFLKDAHSGSSRCAPSRYMLMTGRYSLEDKKERIILPDREPHLGSMFKKAGYKTAIFGKSQPLQTWANNEDQEAQNKQQKDMAEWREKYEGIKKHRDSLFYQPGNYYLKISETDYNYDYSFTSMSPCCGPNGFFENGNQTESFSKYAIQRYYPEGGTKKERGGSEFPSNAYVAAPFPDQPIEGEKYTSNYPNTMIAQPNFDSRLKGQVVSEKLTDFIREQEHSEQPFFAYYGMRSGHSPFNTPLKFRNTTEAGILGEMIAEVDEIVGNIFQALEESDKLDNTLIVFMSDNGGARNINSFMQSLYGHTQNAIDFAGENVKLKGGKGTQHEGGHRLPFMWWYPKQFQARTIEDKTVSYLDVFR